MNLSKTCIHSSNVIITISSDEIGLHENTTLDTNSALDTSRLFSCHLYIDTQRFIFDDFVSTVDISEGGSTYNDLIRSIHGYTLSFSILPINGL